MRKDGLKKHQSVVHEGIKPHKCDSCDLRFAGTGEMKRHKSIIHDGKRPYKCDICDCGISTKTKLETHIADLKKYNVDHSDKRPCLNKEGEFYLNYCDRRKYLGGWMFKIGCSVVLLYCFYLLFYI